MRRGVWSIIIAAGLLSGCAASNKPVPRADLAVRCHPAAASMALAFDLPAKGSRPMPVLTRDDREVSAYGGFAGLSSEFYDVQVDDDQQFYNFPSSYERRVQSDRVGVIYR